VVVGVKYGNYQPRYLYILIDKILGQKEPLLATLLEEMTMGGLALFADFSSS
jgi:hypothetical protein